MAARSITADRVLIPPIAGAQALVVDDWKQSAHAIRNALAEENVIPAWARNATEAITMTAAVGFDLIVLTWL
jgi:PleD family two-component response regulator